MPSWFDKRATHIDAILFDVDGVLTRGDLLYGPEGEIKVFHAHDGHAFVLAKRVGLKIGVITSRTSEAVRRRMEDLGVEEFVEGTRDKGQAVKDMLHRMDVRASGAAFVGDDLVDLPAMSVVGLPIAVANAVPEVKERAMHVTERAGGEGAAREIIELVLKAKGLWLKAIQPYLDGGERA